MQGRLLLEVGHTGAGSWTERDFVLQDGMLQDVSPAGTQLKLPISGALLRNPKTSRGLFCFRLKQKGQKLTLAGHTFQSVMAWVDALTANGARSSFTPPLLTLLSSDPPELVEAKAAARAEIAQVRTEMDTQLAEEKAAVQAAVAKARTSAQVVVADARAAAQVAVAEAKAAAQAAAQVEVTKAAAEAERSIVQAKAAMKEAGLRLVRAATAAESPTLSLGTEKFILPTAAEEANASDNWNLMSWLLGAGVHRVVAGALRLPLTAGGLENDHDAVLGLLRSLKGRNDLARLLRTEALLEAIIDLVWAEVDTLQRAGAASASEVQSKFAGSTEMSYSGLDTFFGGLEGVIGAPSAKLWYGMAADHLEGIGSESTDTFITSNYGVETSSETEWLFVVDSEATPERLHLAHWPEEDVAKLPDRSKCRTRRPLVELEQAAKSRNEELSKANQPPVIREEVVAANLYTGPVSLSHAATCLRARCLATCHTAI